MDAGLGERLERRDHHGHLGVMPAGVPDVVGYAA